MVLVQSTAIPHISSMGRKDAKSLILSILCKEWPLCPKEIYSRIRDRNGDMITYQGVHKAILQLAADEVLAKNQSKYAISSLWISKVKKFGEDLESAFAGRRCVHLSEVAQNSSIQIVFDSVVDYFYWLLDELCANDGEGGEEGAFIVSYHPWPITHLSKSSYSKLKSFLTSHKNYVACKSNTNLDRALISIWKTPNTSVKTKSECSKNCDMLAFKDYVIQLFLPKDTKILLGRLYSGKDPNWRSFMQFYSLLYDHAEPVNVLISRNPELASQLKEEVMAEFSN